MPFKSSCEPAGPGVSVRLFGAFREVPAGISVAAALFLSGERSNRRSHIGHGLRGPFCLMGSCFECIVEIDGREGRRACMTLVADGMRVERQPDV